MKLIDKDALVAVIDKFMYGANLEADIASTGECFNEEVADAKYQLCKQIKDTINTLEVKEVDLDFMLHEYWNLSSKITVDCLESATMTKDEMINFAKHFFELGIKAQKGEKV